MTNYTYFNTKFSYTVRSFSTYKPLLVNQNDQDKLFQEADDLNGEWNYLDGKVEELFKNYREEEEREYEVEDSDGEELGETEVSKYVAEREARKDDIIGRYEELRDVALFDKNNVREDKSLLLDYINKTTKDDIETLETVEKQTSGVEDYYDQLSETLSELKNHEKKI